MNASQQVYLGLIASVKYKKDYILKIFNSIFSSELNLSFQLPINDVMLNVAGPSPEVES